MVNRKQRYPGFTLVELLVVIAILALLLSILLPSLNRSRVQARRVMCGSRMRQLLAGARIIAEEDSRGRLPRGGIYSGDLGQALQATTGPVVTVFPPPGQPKEPPSDFVIEDASLMMGAQYFNLGAVLAGGSAAYQGPMTMPEVDTATRILHQKGLRKLFVCPEAERHGEPFSSDLPLYQGQLQYPPAIVSLRHAEQSLWIVHLGFLYFGGFETSQWPDPQPAGSRYQAPVRASDPGRLVLMTDPLRFWPSQEELVLPHTARGYIEQTGPEAVRNDPRQVYEQAGMNIGHLDGSVEYKTLRNLEMRPAYCENGQYTTDVWTFF